MVKTFILDGCHVPVTSILKLKDGGSKFYVYLINGERIEIDAYWDGTKIEELKKYFGIE